MQIFVDADACPKLIKDIIYRAANRKKIIVTLVANQVLSCPPSPFIKTLRVSPGFDVADNKILEIMQAGDLVITADIPLAHGVVTQGGIALNPRGELYTVQNINERLAIRDLSTSLRDSGVRSGGPARISPKEIQNFANALDKFLATSTPK